MPIRALEELERPPAATSILSWVLAVVSAVTCALTLLHPGVLRGRPAMDGSARGTALVLLFVGVPVLGLSVRAARNGSGLAQLTWLGALGFLGYNALMFLFATPFNGLFLLYVAWLGLTIWALGLCLSTVDVERLAARFAATRRQRVVAVYIWVVVALNALAWLGEVVPALRDPEAATFLRGTGLSTDVVFVQDLALWLPLMAVVGLWLWRRQSWGLVLAVGGLVLWVLESVSVAVDQAYGAAADPGSPVASAALTPVFATLAALGVVPVLLLLAGFDGEGLGAKARRLAPISSMRTSRRWLLSMVCMMVSGLATWGGVALVRDGFGIPRSWLTGTPFTSWTWPGVALIVVVAGPHLITAALLVLRSRWSRLAGQLCGGSLIVWIALQLVVLQHFFVLQPVVVAVGVVELWLAGRPPVGPVGHATWVGPVECSGVVWTADPRTGDRGRLVVEAVRGRGLAAGRPDVYVVQREPLHIVAVHIGRSAAKVITGPDGRDVPVATTDDEQDERVPTAEEILQVARYVVAHPVDEETPQAIAWAMTDGRVRTTRSAPNGRREERLVTA